MDIDGTSTVDWIIRAMKWIVSLRKSDISNILQKKVENESKKNNTMTNKEDSLYDVWNGKNKSDNYIFMDSAFHDCNDGIDNHGGYLHFTLEQLLSPSIRKVADLKRLIVLFKESMIFGYAWDQSDRMYNHEGGSNVPIAVKCIALMAIKFWKIFQSLQDDFCVFSVSKLCCLFIY